MAGLFAIDITGYIIYMAGLFAIEYHGLHEQNAVKDFKMAMS